MSRCRFNIARLGTPDPVLVSYAGRDATTPLPISFSVRLFESYLVESQFLSYFPALYDIALTF